MNRERCFGMGQEVCERPVRRLLEAFYHVRRDRIIGAGDLFVQAVISAQPGDSRMAFTALQNATALCSMGKSSILFAMPTPNRHSTGQGFDDSRFRIQGLAIQGLAI